MGERRVDAGGAAEQGSPDNHMQMMASFEEMRKEKYVPFTLGPLYLAGDLNEETFDVIKRFVEDKKVPVFVQHIDFTTFKLFDMPGKYGHRVYAMNDEAYGPFVKYLEETEVIDRERGRYFQIVRFAAPIMDPFMRFIGTSKPVPETIDVWTAMGLGGFIAPKTHVETLPYPIFRPGEAEDMERAEFLRRLPRPTTAPMLVEFERKDTVPAVIQRGLTVLGELR